MKRIRIVFVYGILGILFAACSTTKNLPEGEVLYTGIKNIDVAEHEKSQAADDALEEVESALSYPPNNSLFGSSKRRIPLPIGLWIYNAFVNKEGGIGRWIFNRFAAKPVFISTVNPEVRAAVAHNLLRENGYFDGTTGYEVLPDDKNPRKAKINYSVELNHGYTYDSIRYMRMRHYADTLINATMDERMLHKDDQFNVIRLEGERQRISTLLRNNGFYYFRPNFIVYEADTLLTPGKVWLRVKRQDGLPPNALRPYRIGNIAVNIRGFDNEQPTDSVQYRDMMVYYQGKLRIRPRVLYGRFTFKPGDIYKQTEQQRTQTGLSRLSVFNYSEFQYTPRDTSRRNNILDVQVNTVYDLPLDGELELNVAAKSNDYLGPGAVFSVTKRNAFRGGELLGVQLKGSYEWNTGNRGGQSASRINSYEIGISSTLTIPFVLFPGYMYRDLVQPSTTTFRVSADLLNRAKFFRMLSIGGSMEYDFRPTLTTRHTITPFRLTYNKLYPTDFFRDSIAEQNRGLLLSLQDQFIPAMGYTFTYDNNAVSKRNQFWWQTSVTQSGLLVNGISAIAGNSFNKEGKKLFGSPYSQFIKGTTEVRYNFQLDRNNRLVARLGLGAIYSYGNARISPYSEQFFVGGANSIRAFTIRSIGPGRYEPPLRPDGTQNPYAFIDRTGDLKLEANLEYRFNIVGDLHGAVFLDSGGIWLIRQDDDRPGSRLKSGKFFNDLATGTGVGLRYDLSFLVVRLDVGLALHVPYDTEKSGYFNVNPFKQKSARAWHLAIGYPF